MPFIQSLERVAKFFYDLLLPPHCVCCKAVGSWLCVACLSDIFVVSDTVCNRCGESLLSNDSCQNCQRNPLYYIDGIRSATYYREDSPIRFAIHALKYHNHRAIIEPLGQFLIDAYQRYGLKVDSLIPVPLHASRLRERGYNQSELLARSLSQTYQLPIQQTVLQRIRSTQVQAQLKFTQRRQNVQDAFACDIKPLPGQTVLLIDDVCTTGATLDSCAASLKQAGFAAVWGLTLARAPHLV